MITSKTHTTTLKGTVYADGDRKEAWGADTNKQKPKEHLRVHMTDLCNTNVFPSQEIKWYAF